MAARKDTGWTWREVRMWAEDYSGDCSGEVKRLLKLAISGDQHAWRDLTDLYLRSSH